MGHLHCRHKAFFVPARGDYGAFDLSAVPPGQYTIVAWHERVGERAERVRVDAGKATSVELSVPVGDAP